ncbi:tryptophan--tRNA ligase [Patescibacteria group bacterium]
MSKIFSGIQPTGLVHIGNYLGAIKQWVKLQDKNDCIFCVVDLHALTVEQDPKAFPQQVLNLAIDYLALGIDPAKSILFVQSHVPEHTELTWIFNTLTPIGELERMTQYKEKSQQNTKNINTGLFDYPVLMAADILLYKTDTVPVGQDQVQHIEITRTIARKFNNKYGQTFQEPKPLLTKGARIMGLSDAKQKMSKSLNNYVGLFEDEESIKAKFKKATTDSGNEVKADESKPEISNLLDIYSAFSGKSIEEAEQEFAGKGYGDFKEALGQTVADALAPYRAKREELAQDPDAVKQVLADGAKKAKAIAEQTMDEVKEKVGLRL